MEIIKGWVKKGRGLGKVMGFPTLNMDYEGQSNGVFAGRVVFSTGDENYGLKGAVHVGPRPTINDPQPVCEVFILDFPHELNDKSFEGIEIELHLLQKIREIEKFPTLDALTAQIAKDVAEIENLLAERN